MYHRPNNDGQPVQSACVCSKLHLSRLRLSGGGGQRATGPSAARTPNRVFQRRGTSPDAARPSRESFAVSAPTAQMAKFHQLCEVHVLKCTSFSCEKVCQFALFHNDRNICRSLTELVFERLFAPAARGMNGGAVSEISPSIHVRSRFDDYLCRLC